MSFTCVVALLTCVVTCDFMRFVLSDTFFTPRLPYWDISFAYMHRLVYRLYRFFGEKTYPAIRFIKSISTLIPCMYTRLAMRSLMP